MGGRLGLVGDGWWVVGGGWCPQCVWSKTFFHKLDQAAQKHFVKQLKAVSIIL